MLLELINPEALFSLHLVGAAGTRHAKLKCRITDIKPSEQQDELVLQIVSLKQRNSTYVWLRRAVDEYLVEPHPDDHPPAGRAQVSLRKYLVRRHRRLLRAWPNKSLQQEILHGLLDSTCDHHRKAGTKSRWLQEATRWLQIETLLASASRGQSTREFFLDVKRKLVENYRQLARPMVPQEYRRTWHIELTSGPNPASLLPGVHLAQVEAQSAAASAGTAAVSLLPFLETALENHWRRMFREDPALTFAEDRNTTTVTASVQTPAAGSDPLLNAAGDGNQDSEDADEDCRIELRVPFLASPQPDRDAHLCTAILLARAAAAERDLHKRLAPLKHQLAFHLKDTLWALKEFFSNHSLIVSPTTKLIFRDRHELHRWLTTAPAIDVEDRIRRLYKCWMGAGAPQSSLGGEPATCQVVGQWLLQLREPAAGEMTSMGHEPTRHTAAAVDFPSPHRKNANKLLLAAPHSHATASITVTFPVWRHRQRGLFSLIWSRFRGMGAA